MASKQFSYYQVLEIEPWANMDEIKKAYRKKAHQLHPDKNSADSDTKEFQLLNEAYEFLQKKYKRRNHTFNTQNDDDPIFDYLEPDDEAFFNFEDVDIIKYNTDLFTLTCDCDDWQDNRSTYKKNDPRRLCKHIISEFHIPQLGSLTLPQELKAFQIEIVQNRIDETGFPLYKELLFFNSSVAAITDDEKNIYLYIKEHPNTKCLYNRLHIYKAIDNRYKWAQNYKNNKISKDIVSESNEKNLLDAKEYLNKRFKIKNSDITLCLSHQLELQEEALQRDKVYKQGYLLSKFFEYNLRSYVFNNNEDETYQKIDKYVDEKEKALFEYDTVTNLLKQYKSRFTTRSFNKKLQEMGYFVKNKHLNNNSWILKGEALQYGMNYVYNSKYTHIKIPNWYILTRFDFYSLSFKQETRYGLMRMSKVLFKKDNFPQLLEIMNRHISQSKQKEQKADTTGDTVQDYTKPSFMKLHKEKQSIFQKIKNLLIDDGM